MMAAAVILRATNVTTLQTPHLKPGTGHGTARLPFRVRCGVLWWVSLTSTGALGVPSWVVEPQLETFSAHGVHQFPRLADRSGTVLCVL